jgi:hypothetical protein
MFLTQNQHRPERDNNVETDSNLMTVPTTIPTPIPTATATALAADTMPRISSSLEKYGWFEDVDHHNEHSQPEQFLMLDEYDDDDTDQCAHRLHEHELQMSSDPAALHASLSLPLPLTEPPSYILESPLTTQHLW